LPAVWALGFLSEYGVQMKNIPISIALSSMLLFSCGGSEGSAATGTSKKDFIEILPNTSWKRECFAYNILSSADSTTLWYVNIRVSINSSLQATYRTEFFRPTDTACDSLMFDTINISKFEITGKVISEESIEAYGLNETFIYHSDNNESPASYTLIYIDSEKLYFGQKSGSNLGDTPETRHSSISLDDYFTRVLN